MKLRFPAPALAALALLGLAPSAWAQVDARMLRHAAVSATQIAFVYAGDIWLVPKEGGVAHRLSTPTGEESFPRFSPDGSQIAYTADYDGNLDIYVVPTAGGTPVRLTHHPAADRMLGWYPDGKSILFATSMTSGKDRFNQLYRLAATGGLPERLPVPYGEFASLSPDARTIAYVPASLDFRTWKRYRGGWVPDIWTFDLATHKSRNLTRSDDIDGQPMWHGNTIYFLCDGDTNKRANVWAYDLQADRARQLTHFEQYDVRFPSLGPQDLVFEADDRLYRMDLASEKMQEVKVQVFTDRATLRPRTQAVSSLLRTPGISPSGKRAVVEARGAAFTIPAENGVVLTLAAAPGAAARLPAWSPDGKTIAYWSDRTGEYELTVRPADGSGSERTVTSLGPGFRYRIFWSPDSKRVAFIDSRMRVQIAEVATGAVSTVDQALYYYQGNLQAFRPSWSADGRWLAYARDLPSRQVAVFLYDTRAQKAHQVTSGFYSDAEPVFDPGGKYLFLLTGRTFRPSYSDLDNTWIYANSTNVAAIPLRKDVPSPLAPRNDVEGEDKPEKKDEDEDESKDESKDEKPREERKKEPAKPVEIDLAGFEERIVLLPAVAGNYDRLAAVSGKVVYRRAARTGAVDDEKHPEKSPLVFYDLEAREEKTILPDVDGFEVAAGGKKVLAWKKDDYVIVDVKADQKLDKKLATKGLELTVDPVAEWRQIFNDAWRFERDYFYDPAMHGVDWKAMRERYAKLLQDAVTRWDVNFVIGEMISELNASHTYRGGGDTEKGLERGVGLLGVDFALENGAYRIKRIVRGAPWDAEVRSPLLQPGVNVSEGDYLLAVNRVPLDVRRDPWSAFQGLAKKTVVLTVNSRPTTEGARDVLVETLESEARLRNLAWIEEKRRRVDQATNGRVGYVYVPDTGLFGQTELVRQFLGQFQKDGLIIDERFNSGGQIPDRFIELLNRPFYNYWGVRDGRDWQWPPVAHQGPKVMLINGWSGSGGDAFPLYFRQAGLGPLIGTRTWGGLIGISGVPPLVDGGNVTVPTFGIYSTDGKWIVEGHGVEPDIEVVDDPSLMADGGDPQLDRAIAEVTKRMETTRSRPSKPSYPDRAGR